MLGSQRNCHVQRVPVYPELPYRLPISIPHQRATFVAINEVTLTHHYRSKSTVYIMVHSWYVLSWTNVYFDMDPI